MNERDLVTKAEEKGSLHEEKEEGEHREARLHVTFGGFRSVMERARIAGKLGHLIKTCVKTFHNRMILI